MRKVSKGVKRRSKHLNETDLVNTEMLDGVEKGGREKITAQVTVTKY